ncbi:hypothetical protein EXIGLDRAFT_782227, partial [Exidia glandulosa HHB12029]
MASLVPIPHPPGYPLVGNIFDLDPEVPLQALEDFAKVYGEIYSLTFFGNTVNVVNSHALALEILDERR